MLLFSQEKVFTTGMRVFCFSMELRSLFFLSKFVVNEINAKLQIHWDLKMHLGGGRENLAESI